MRDTSDRSAGDRSAARVSYCRLSSRDGFRYPGYRTSSRRYSQQYHPSSCTGISIPSTALPPSASTGSARSRIPSPTLCSLAFQATSASMPTAGVDPPTTLTVMLSSILTGVVSETPRYADSATMYSETPALTTSPATGRIPSTGSTPTRYPTGDPHTPFRRDATVAIRFSADLSTLAGVRRRTRHRTANRSRSAWVSVVSPEDGSGPGPPSIPGSAPIHPNPTVESRTASLR